jgi:hypothetical protein
MYLAEYTIILYFTRLIPSLLIKLTPIMTIVRGPKKLSFRSKYNKAIGLGEPKMDSNVAIILQLPLLTLCFALPYKIKKLIGRRE